jgi:hypothetical protein
MRTTISSISCLIGALGCVGAAHAASEPDDAAALELADKAPTAQQVAEKGWRAYVEGAGTRAWGGDPASAADGWRGSLDLRVDTRPAAGWRAVLSDRLDLTRREDATPRERNINALREAYVSWQPRGDWSVDLGRVNVRHGIGWGYNPTDYFRGGALRSIVSPDPASLRENRLGTVVVQAQTLWTDSSLSATYSPKLASTPNRDDTWSADLGSTNARHRWLLAASHRFSERLSPELLLHGGQDTPTQLGLNVSSLLNSATVAFAEGSFGRGRPLLSQALGTPADNAWQRRAALGLTFTTAFNLNLTVEADFNSAAPDRAQWDALRASGLPAMLAVLQTAQDQQELPVRRGSFLYATWHDAGVRRFDLSAFMRHDFVTHSRAQWLEGRYHLDKVDLALQWLVYSGSAGSLYGTVPQRRTIEASARVYF